MCLCHFTFTNIFLATIRQFCALICSCIEIKPLFVPLDNCASTSWQSHVLDRWCTAMDVDVAVIPYRYLRLRSKTNHNKLLGCRVGEAKNPGPQKSVATFAIVNPTSLNQKFDDFCQLKNDYDIDVFACSETSATEQIQQQFTQQMRQIGFFSQWSAPVQPQRLKLDLVPSKRGKAGGTSLHSCLPSRLCCNPPPTELIASNRIVHSILRVGELHIQTFVIYGMTGSVAGHVEFTNNLFNHAIHMSKEINIPSIFMGDFNIDVHKLEGFHSLQETGFVTLQQKFLELYGEIHPPTCKGSTTPDTAIIHPVISNLVLSILVDKQCYFDTHSPVVFKMQIPHQQICRNTFRYPSTWITLPVDQSDLESVLPLTLEQNGTPTTLEEWGHFTEDLVDNALRHNDHPEIQPMWSNGLPKKFRGRCKPRKSVEAPWPAQAKFCSL